MDKHRLCLRALHLLPLIVYFQVPSSSALPFGATYENTDEAPDPDCLPEATPQSISVNSIGHSDLEQSAPSTSIDWQPTAYEIADGQVQAPYTAITEEVVVTSSSTTITSSTTATSHHSYTPVPRQLTPSWSSTSTSTVYVFASATSTGATSGIPAISSSTTAVTTPANSAMLVSSTAESSQQSFTTTLPNSLLTSLTTSEVQTATAPVPTNTSGVSMIPSSSRCAIEYNSGDVSQVTTMACKGGTCDWWRRFGYTGSAVWTDCVSRRECLTSYHQVSARNITDHNSPRRSYTPLLRPREPLPQIHSRPLP